jgi:hypothetical protein
MTALADLNAITLTANAIKLGQTNGTDLVALLATCKSDVVELRRRLMQLISFHPTGGGDAANLSALNAVVAELA